MERATEDDLKVYELERAVLPEIIRMEHTGIRVVPDRVAELLATHRVLQQQVEERLNELNGYEDFNPESPEDVIRFLGARGIVLTDLTENGAIRTDKGVLERHSGMEEVDLILEHRNHSKLISTYLEPMEGKEYVYPNFRQIGAWTGRMSSFRPNMQNIPARTGPEIRSMFVPRDGHAFVVADYGSIELRLLAYYMNDENLWSIIEDGDPFEWMGEQIYGTRDQNAWAVPRQNLKNGTYAIIYGAGGPKLAKTIGGGLTDQQGRALKRAITDVLGGRYYGLQRRVRKAVEDRGYVRTLAGRTQHVPTDRSYVGLNALIQGSAADVMKWGIVKSAEYLRPHNAYPLLTVHDELLVETPLTNIPAVQKALETGMIEATPIKMKVESVVCYNNYGEAK
jgi:DNA polymerase-1